MFEGHRVVKLK